MHHERLLTRAQVCDVVGLRKSEIYRRIRAGRFPAPPRVGQRAVRWRQSEIYRWLESLERAESAAPR